MNRTIDWNRIAGILFRFSAFDNVWLITVSLTSHSSDARFHLFVQRINDEWRPYASWRDRCDTYMVSAQHKINHRSNALHDSDNNSNYNIAYNGLIGLTFLHVQNWASAVSTVYWMVTCESDREFVFKTTADSFWHYLLFVNAFVHWHWQERQLFEAEPLKDGWIVKDLLSESSRCRVQHAHIKSNCLFSFYSDWNVLKNNTQNYSHRVLATQPSINTSIGPTSPLFIELVAIQPLSIVNTLTECGSTLRQWLSANTH